MIYFRTGTPGAGKTAHTLIEVKERSEKEERRVLYTDVALNTDALPDWVLLEDPSTWRDVAEPGDIFLIDECHKYMRQRGKNAGDVPQWIEALAEHRHMGVDFYLVTQHLMDVDVFVRRRGDQHIHYERKSGTRNVVRYKWDTAQSDPTDYHARQACIKEVGRIPTESFDLYHSAEIHTDKPRVPWLLVGGVALVGFLVWFIASTFDWMASGFRDELPEVVTSGAPPSAAFDTILSPSSRSYREEPMSFDEYENRMRPRFAGMPSTAPMYDDLTTKVVDVPKPHCICAGMCTAADRCMCMTQQATVMTNYPTALCRNHVRNGLFDPARTPVRSDRRATGSAQPQTKAEPFVAAPARPLSASTWGVPDSTEYPSRSLR